MKIAIFSPSKSNISETFIQAQVSRLQGEIILYHTGDIPSCLNDTVLMSSQSPVERLTYSIRKRLGKTPLTAAENVLYQSLQQEKPDVLLVQYGITAAKNLRVIKLSGIPLVIHFHGYDASMYSVLEKNKQAYTEMFAYASAIIGVSKKMVEMLSEMGAPAEKLHHLCYGPNPRFESVSPQYGEQQFLGLGRFVDKKAPHLTILAFKQVLEKYPQAQLRMIGTGPLLMTCKDLVSYYKLEQNVHFPGAHGIDRVLEEMQHVCAFVQHSRRALDGDMEGTPVAILEAQLAGLPVISTLHAGIPDVVISGETGLLVSENDVDGMARCMIRILDDSAGASSMGTKARAHVVENFTMEKYISRLQEVVEKAARR